MIPDQERWDRKYLDRGREAFQASAAAPAGWLSSHRDLLERQAGRRGLDVACGSGRHARYLARLGYTVDALDVSALAVEWLREDAEREGVPVYPRRCDLATEPLEVEAYDIVVNFYYLERRLFPRLERSLAPGGLLIFETFTHDHVELSGRPRCLPFTLAPGELRGAFADLEIVAERETTLFIDDPARARAVASLVARARSVAGPRGRAPRRRG